jgi:hypothetical protein
MMRTKIAAFALAFALVAPFAAAAEDAPGVFKIPGTDSTIKFNGYVQLDTTIDFSGRPSDIENNDWATILPAVPSDKSAEAKKKKPQLYMTARTSRFSIVTNTPTKMGAIGVRLEGDFNGPNGFQSETFTNSVLFRLRHAYGTVGGLLVGQTWSTFLDLGAAPDTVDFNGPGNLALVRNPMIRYTFDLAPGASLALAAENTRGGQFGPGSDLNRWQSIPDFHAALTYGGSWGHVSLRGVTQRFNRIGTLGTGSAQTVDPNASAKSVQGFAGSLSGSLKLGGDTLVAQVSGGPGIGRYMLNALFMQGAVAAKNAAGDLEAITHYGYHVAYTHVWNPEFRSTGVWAQTFAKDPKFGGVATTSGIENTMQAFVNTFYSFAKNAEFGIEYTYGQWKAFHAAGASADKGTENRVNASFHYNFF